MLHRLLSDPFHLMTWPVVAAMIVAAVLARAASGEVVVLTDGAVHVGEVEEKDEAITITTGQGPMIVPTVRVEVRAESLTAAYEQLAKRMTTEPQHLALGRWCIKHRLLSQAEEQFAMLNAKLRADSMEALREKQKELANPSKKAVTLPTIAGPSRDDVGARIASGYRTQVSPLLRNGCGMARCHGRASDQPLKLLTGNRIADLQTGEALLRRIDKERPLDSELLDYASRPHGGATTIATDPTRYPARYAKLRDWVLEAATAERFGADRDRRPTYQLINGAVRRAKD